MPELVNPPIEFTDPRDREPTRRRIAVDKHKEEAETAKSAAKALDSLYLKLAKDPAFEDLRTKLKTFQEYHLKLAQDGVGYEQYIDSNGQAQQKAIRFTPEERSAHLDKAGGIQEILDYVERRLQIETSQ